MHKPVRDSFNGMPENGQVRMAIPDAKQVLTMRRWRDAVAPDNYFGEPSWDIMLTIWVAHESNREVTMQHLTDTMIAYDILENHVQRLIVGGLIDRMGEGRDAALGLTHRGAAMMETIFNVDPNAG
ncbi:MAG: hypothetical protein ACTS1Z_00150 [Parasphingopyxis sp.]|uniref:hypothetical protein n=1 Tax=Parasphingopyxis sp. TaxID=1920299 RepID=UPI003F9FE831